MRKYLIHTVFFFISIFSFSVCAVDYVYRADFRSPEQVFREGFGSRGDNRDILQHFFGLSCSAGTLDSAYISTSARLSGAMGIARFYLRSDPNDRIWIYTIRADRNFYPLLPSINYIESRGVNLTIRERFNLRRQREVVSHVVPAQNIREASLVTWNRQSRSINIVESVSNSRYQHRETHANEGVMPGITYHRKFKERKKRSVLKETGRCIDTGNNGDGNIQIVKIRGNEMLYMQSLMSELMGSD